MTDYKYMHDGVTDWMKKWKVHDWRTVAKKSVLNQNTWVKLDATIDELENCGVRILFWWVARAQNKEANLCAKFGYSRFKDYDEEDRPNFLFEQDLEQKSEELQQMLNCGDGPFVCSDEGPSSGGSSSDSMEKRRILIRPGPASAMSIATGRSHGMRSRPAQPLVSTAPARAPTV